MDENSHKMMDEKPQRASKQTNRLWIILLTHMRSQRGCFRTQRQDDFKDNSICQGPQERQDDFTNNSICQGPPQERQDDFTNNSIVEGPQESMVC